MNILSDLISFVIGSGLGFIGAFIVIKYETKTSDKIASTVSDTLDTATKVVDDIKK